MVSTKKQLDTPICDLLFHASNPETVREYIVNTEKEFDLIPKDIDSMTEEHLNEYLDFLDYLWDK